MLLSETDLKVDKLSEEQIKTIVFRGIQVDQDKSDAAVVLGSDPQQSIERAKLAYSFYQKAGVEKTVVSGGVKHSYNGTLLSESELMRRYLNRSGVHKENILMENRSRNTIENMIYSLCVLCENFDLSEMHRVTIITSPYHLKRSLLLAGLFFPRYIEICGYTEGINELMDKTQTEESVRARMKNEVLYLQQLIQKRMIDDIAF